MDNVNHRPRPVADEFQGIGVVAVAMFAAAFFLWDLTSTGSISWMLAVLTVACASIPAGLTYFVTKKSANRYRERSIRVYFPLAAALLCSQTVILPVYLALAPAAGA